MLQNVRVGASAFQSGFWSIFGRVAGRIRLTAARIGIVAVLLTLESAVTQSGVTLPLFYAKRLAGAGSG